MTETQENRGQPEQGTDMSADRLLREIRASQAANDRVLRLYDKLRRQYATPAFYGEDDPTAWGDDYQPDNHAYKTVSYIVPQLIYGRPKVRIKAASADPEDQIHLEMLGAEHATNQWIIDTDYRSVQEQIAADPLFAFGVALVLPTRSAFAYSQTSHKEAWPEVQRISPRNFFRDPMALDPEGCKWLGHRTRISKAELLEAAEANPDAGWDVDALKRLGSSSSTGHGVKGYRPDEYREDGLSSDREEIEVYELWWKSPPRDEQDDEHGPEDGYHGRVYTLALEQGDGGQRAQFIRKPYPWYGDRTGPYAMAGIHRMPDSPYAAAPLVVQYPLAREVNLTFRALGRAVRNYKRGTAVDGEFIELVERLNTGKFDEVFPVKGVGAGALRDHVVTVEAGGAPVQGYQWAEAMRQLLMQVSGMGEAQSGNAPPQATATAVAVATRESGVRLDRIKEEFQRWNEAILRKVAFYIATSEDVTIGLGGDAAEEIGEALEQLGLPSSGLRAKSYRGGTLTPQDFDSASVTIDAFSIQRTTEEQVQQRAIQAFTLLSGAVGAMAQIPAPRFWSELFEQVGDSINVPNMGDHVQRFYEELPQAASAAQSLGTAAGGGPEAPESQAAPRVTVAEQSGGGNRTPGLRGVEQPVPLQGTGGPKARTAGKP
jgi:hypothetical protein